MSDTKQEESQSYILVQFMEVGSAVFEIAFHNVIPSQVLACAAALELRGKNAFIQEENAKADRQLAVAKPKIVTPGSMR